MLWHVLKLSRWLVNTFRSVSVQAALEHRLVTTEFERETEVKGTFIVTAVTMSVVFMSLPEPCQLPDQYCTCATFKRYEKEITCLTPNYIQWERAIFWWVYWIKKKNNKTKPCPNLKLCPWHTSWGCGFCPQLEKASPSDWCRVWLRPHFLSEH